MERESFNKAINIYHYIKAMENKKTELYGLRNKIIQILEGYIEIPEEEVFAVFNKLEKLSQYLEKDIQKAYKEIDELG